MAITLGSNIAALRAQRQLSGTSADLGTVFERLSSGQRINRASDDAAGLAIASSLNAGARVYAQAQRNVSDAISLLSVHEGALGSLTDILIRQRELAQQAANGVYTLTQRKALNAEADALVKEYNRIVESAEFNGRRLLTQPGTALQIQAGSGSDAILSMSIGRSLARTVGDGTFGNITSFASGPIAWNVDAADFNGDGRSDVFTDGRVFLANNDGTFLAPIVVTPGGAGDHTHVMDFNGDGRPDIVEVNFSATQIRFFRGNGAGGFTLTNTQDGPSISSDIASGDFNSDGIADLVALESFGGDDSAYVYLGNADGTFSINTTAYGYGLVNNPTMTDIGDLNGDGNLDFVVGESLGMHTYLGDGRGGFTSGPVLLPGYSIGALGVADFNNDGLMDIGSNAGILLGNGGGSFSFSQTFAGFETEMEITDLNGDGVEDIVAVDSSGPGKRYMRLGNGDGTFRASTLTLGYQPQDIAVGDFNGDGVNDVVQADYTNDRVYVYFANTSLSAKMPVFSLLSQSDTRQSMSVIDSAMDRVSAERGAVGALQSRLSTAANNLAVQRENFLSAASRISDADIAEESAELTRLNILQQAASAVLAQANQQPALALQLLR